MGPCLSANSRDSNKVTPNSDANGPLGGSRKLGSSS